MKGVSPLIAEVLLILIVLLIAATIGPWMLNIAKQSSESTNSRINQDLLCRQTSYDFDTDYGNSGATWDFTSDNKTVSVKIINTGMENLYNFTIQLTLLDPNGNEVILSYPNVAVTEDTQKTKSNPLKPGEECILEAYVSGVDSTWTLKEIRVINPVCPRVSPSLEI